MHFMPLSHGSVLLAVVKFFQQSFFSLMEVAALVPKQNTDSQLQLEPNKER